VRLKLQLREIDSLSDFVEHISGVRMIPRSTEMEDENTDPQTDPDIQFQVRVKGWSDLIQQNRAKTLLT
jgi:hypothetical protein